MRFLAFLCRRGKAKGKASPNQPNTRNDKGKNLKCPPATTYTTTTFSTPKDDDLTKSWIRLRQKHPELQTQLISMTTVKQNRWKMTRPVPVRCKKS